MADSGRSNHTSADVCAPAVPRDLRGTDGGRQSNKLLILLYLWWAHKGSNLGPLPCEGNALPLSYAPGSRCFGMGLEGPMRTRQRWRFTKDGPPVSSEERRLAAPGGCLRRQPVIPGRAKREPGISRFRVRCFASPRNDGAIRCRWLGNLREDALRTLPGHDDGEALVPTDSSGQVVSRARAAPGPSRVKKTARAQTEIREPIQRCLPTDSSVNPSREKYSTSVFQNNMVPCRHPASMKEGRFGQSSPDVRRAAMDAMATRANFSCGRTAPMRT